MNIIKKDKNYSPAIMEWLDAFPGDVTCVLQVWYEGLGGMGTPAPADIAAIEEALAKADGWEPAGDVRYEKMGVQKSFKRTNQEITDNKERIMVQHMFKLGSLQKAPDGRIFKVMLSEVYNLRCFEVKDDNLIGRMIKIDPTSDFAKSLVEL
ncbi:MAG: hypothetical protein PVG39_31375 [Desulfobacteraceae bacterium]|jgi:hypothetical protein